jgi:hypothetical protein
MNKKELIREIRQDIRKVKNKWFEKAYSFKGFDIKTLRFNNWFKIFRVEKEGSLVFNIPFTMDSKQKDILYDIENVLEELEGL